MTTSDVVTLLLAIWGAVLSTVLAIWGFSKERRKITIILEFVAWEERHQITIVNTGYRPVTITGIRVSGMTDIQARICETIPASSLLEGSVFPVVLRDGEHVSLRLQEVADNMLKGMRSAGIIKETKITVFDATGKSYERFELGELDAKWSTINTGSHKVTTIG